MARRNDHSRQQLKSMAIAMGHKLIAEQGLANFSARKVATEIGYSVGTLYNVFSNYDELLLHINAVTLQQMRSFIAEHTDFSSQGEEFIINLAHAYCNFAEKQPNLWHALFDFTPQTIDIMPQWYTQEIQQIFVPLEQSLEKFFFKDPTKLQLAAKVLWAGIHGICKLGLNGKLKNVNADSIDILTKSLITNYLRGMLLQ